LVVIVNTALVLPAGTVTLAGTLAADGVSLISDTAIPPAGAAPVSVTVPWETMPPKTLVGFIESEFRTGGATVSAAVFSFTPSSAVMVMGVDPLTGYVVIVKVALVLPPGTVTLDGTLAADGMLLLNDTTTPPLGAAPVSVTTPWEVIPPRTLAGFIESELRGTRLKRTSTLDIEVPTFTFMP
jgi:hypothetical protein